MCLTFTSHSPGTSRFSYSASVVGLDTRPPRGILTGIITIRGYGVGIYFSGEFRHFANYLTNFGISRALNSAGVFNEFLMQRLEKTVSEPKLLGLNMTWIFENETPSQALNMTDDSYFYIERVKGI